MFGFSRPGQYMPGFGQEPWYDAHMASLTRQVRLPGARSRPCYAAGLILGAVLLVSSIDSYLFRQRIERAQVAQQLQASESDRARLTRQVYTLQRELKAATARARAHQAQCVQAEPDQQNIEAVDPRPVAVDKLDRATRTRANRAPLNRPAPRLHP